MLAIVGFVLTLLGSVYAKGRQDASRKATLDALKEANDANAKAKAARQSTAHDIERGGLLKDDGFKRD